MHEGQVLDAAAQVVGQADNDGEDHGGGAHDRGADEDGLGGGLEGVAGAVVVLQEVLGPLLPGGEAEVSADLGVDVVDILDVGELVDALGVVGDRAVGVDGDGHWPHPQEAEGDQIEGEDGRGRHE